MDREQIYDLAERMSAYARRQRLQRAGMDPDTPHVPFEQLNDPEQRSWLDAAEAALHCLSAKVGT